MDCSFFQVGKQGVAVCMGGVREPAAASPLVLNHIPTDWRLMQWGSAQEAVFNRPPPAVCSVCSRFGLAQQSAVARQYTGAATAHALRCCQMCLCAAVPSCPAVVAVMLPTLISSTADVVTDFRAELALSRFESVLMLVCYGLFLVFQLVTHR